jgi:hypothetical protein
MINRPKETFGRISVFRQSQKVKTNVYGGIHVGIVSKPTFATLEVFAFPISLPHPSTLRTPLRGKSRVHFFDLDAK